MARESLTLGWIRPLAEPYLRGFRPVLERSGDLRGYWFLIPEAGKSGKGKQSPKVRKQPGRRSQIQVGFFVGYVVGAASFAFLNPRPPECLVFAFVRPVGSALHRRLVRRPDSLLRKTFTYIRWLTHRPPRFELCESELATMVRHCSMRDWPRERSEHFSRNFFIETLAWLVRSGLVRKFLSEPLAAGRPGKASLKAHF